MGMYNNLRCYARVYGKDYSDRRFQTKDIQPLTLEDYKITKEGRLMHMEVKYSTIPLKERRYYKRWMREKEKGNKNAGILKLIGSIKVTKLGWKRVNYHGIIQFHGYAKNGRYMEFYATFNNGSLVGITRPSKGAKQAEEVSLYE